MYVLRLLRNMLIIFACSALLTILLLLSFNVNICTPIIILVLTISSIYSVLSLMLFLDEITSKVNFLLLQVIYVVLLNVVYIIVMHLMNFEFTNKMMYLYIAIASIIIFVTIKSIIFKIDQQSAHEVNDLLQKYKETKKRKTDTIVSNSTCDSLNLHKKGD